MEEHFHIKIGYTTIQEYVKKAKHNYNHQATVRFETMPGLQGQVDWGFFENYTVTDLYGEQKKLYCFLMILGYSRMRYIEFVTDMSTQTLIKCHLNAFDYFGGYPEEILYDNMKQVVIKRLLKQKDSTLNKTFEDFAGFFNFKPVLCRPYRGQTKGKVERTVRYVRENFMVGIKYKDLEDLNKQEGANLFFQLIARRYEKHSTIFTTNKNFEEWQDIFQDNTISAAILDRILHHSQVIKIVGESYRLKERGDLLAKKRQ